MTLGLSNKKDIMAFSAEHWGQKTAYIQEGRKNWNSENRQFLQ